MALVLCSLLPSTSLAFVTLRRTTPDDAAVRWSAAHHAAIDGAGLHDGIQVAIEPEFSEKLALAVTGTMNPADIADINTALAASFRAWESPVLRFAITFEGAAERGEQLGSEIDVFLVPETDEVFTNNSYFGVTFTDSAPVDDRLFTNGTVSPGPAITGSDIFINETILASVAPALTRPQQLAALQRLMMHEIGHALGFHHPNEFPDSNWDTDSNPLNVMAIDPDDPTAGLQPSNLVNPNSVVSNRPGAFEALLFTSLQHDERGGRDVLYPLHAPVCPGDCDENRTVAVNELMQSVNIALEQAEIAACSAADRDVDLHLRVPELVSAVRSALAGCPFDRRIVASADATDLQEPLPAAVTRGTIRLELFPRWDAGAEVLLADLRVPASFAPRVQLVKTGSFLRLVATSGGAEIEVSARVDDWDTEQRREITATWTADSVALYIDGEEVSALLPQPIALPASAVLRIGAPNQTLIRVFARP